MYQANVKQLRQSVFTVNKAVYCKMKLYKDTKLFKENDFSEK